MRRCAIVLVCTLGCSAAEHAAQPPRAGKTTVEVRARNEYQELLAAKRRIAIMRAPFYKRMVQRVRTLDVRAGVMRAFADGDDEWATYDYARAELSLRLHALPFNSEHAYAEDARDVETRIRALEYRLEAIEWERTRWTMARNARRASR